MERNGEIPLIITNNTTGKIRLNLMAPWALNDTTNATTKYTYDFTGVAISGNTTVSLLYRTSDAGSFSEIDLPLFATTVQGVVDALNALGFGGSWYCYTSGANTYIAVYSDSYVFGDINLFDPALGKIEVQFLGGVSDRTVFVARFRYIDGVIQSNTQIIASAVNTSTTDFIPNGFGTTPTPNDTFQGQMSTGASPVLYKRYRDGVLERSVGVGAGFGSVDGWTPAYMEPGSVMLITVEPN